MVLSNPLQFNRAVRHIKSTIFTKVNWAYLHRFSTIRHVNSAFLPWIGCLNSYLHSHLLHTSTRFQLPRQGIRSWKSPVHLQLQRLLRTWSYFLAPIFTWFSVEGYKCQDGWTENLLNLNVSQEVYVVYELKKKKNVLVFNTCIRSFSTSVSVKFLPNREQCCRERLHIIIYLSERRFSSCTTPDLKKYMYPIPIGQPSHTYRHRSLI